MMATSEASSLFMLTCKYAPDSMRLFMAVAILVNLFVCFECNLSAAKNCISICVIPSHFLTSADSNRTLQSSMLTTHELMTVSL